MTGIFYGHALEGGEPLGVLGHPYSYTIILGGTLGATLVQTPMPHLMRTIKLTPWLIKPPANDYPAMIAEIVEWSQTARKEGLLALEDKLETVTDPFARKGLQMLASAREPQAIRATLEAELDTIEELNMAASKFYEAAFVATIYGLMFANIFFLPMGVKLKIYILAQSKYRELIIEGLLLIAGGENPRFIEEQLSSYVAK